LELINTKYNFFYKKLKSYRFCSSVWRLLFFVLIFCLNNSLLKAQIAITAPSLTITTCSFPSNAFALGDIVLTESGLSDIYGSGTVELTVPSGFEFVSEGSISYTGSDLSSVTNLQLLSSSTLSFEIFIFGTSNIDEITLSGVQIRAVNSASGPVNIINSGGTAFVTNLGGASVATLESIDNTPVPGTISFTTAGDTLMCAPANPANITGTASTAPGTISYQWQSASDLAFTTPSNVGTNSTDYDPAGGVNADVYYRRITTSVLNAVSCSDNGTNVLFVDVVTPPTITNGATKTICSGASTAISITSSIPSNYTWVVGAITGSISGATDGNGSTINQTLTNPSNATAGTVEYIITPTSISGLCLGTTFTLTVTVNPLPILTNTLSKTICSGASTNISLTSSVASSYSWTVGTITGSISGTSASSGATINQILNNPSSASAGSVQYLVTPLSSGGSCTGQTYTVTVVVNPIPVVTNTTTKTICSGVGTAISLTSSTPSSFSWTIGGVTGGITGSSASSGATINQTLTNPDNSSAGSVSYAVTPTSTTGSCVGAATTIAVTVNPLPAITNSTTSTICSGQTTAIVLTASASSTFSWTLGTNTGTITGATASSGGTIAQTLTNPSNATSGSIEYVVTPTSTSASCAGSPTTITTTVNPIPLITNTATKTICSGASTNISLTSSAASTYSWTIGTITGSITGTSASSGGTINQVLTNPSSSVSGTVEYVVTPVSTVGLCTGSSYTITVTVNPTPVLTNSSTKSICSGSSTAINLTSSVASSYAWTIGTIVGGITGSSASSGATIGQTLTNPDNTTSGTVQYIITPTSTSGSCVGAATAITVTVNPIPSVTTASTATICSGETTALALSATAASSFSWTLGTNTGTISGATASSGGSIAQTLTNPSASVVGSIEYLVTPTSTVGSCAGSATTITVTVNPKPLITNTATKTICSGASTNIVITSAAASTYSWTIGTITGSITGASASSGGTINQVLTNPSSSVAGTVEYVITPVSTGGLCTGNSYTITVSVNPIPVVTNASTKSICSGASTAIALTSSFASSFTWTIGTNIGAITGSSASSGASIAQTLTNPDNTTAGSVQYLVTPTSTSGSCVGSATAITVTVNPTPSVTTSSTSTVCSGTATSISLIATAASSFSWTLGTNTGSITGASASSGSSIAQTLVNPSTSASNTIEYLVTPTSTTGSCVGSASTITVTVNPSPVITNSSTHSICSGASTNLTLTSTVASNYSWTIGTITGSITGSSAGSGGTINQALTNPSSSASGSVQYLVTPTSTGGTCAGTPYTITVTVNPIPAITNATTKTICSGSSVALPLTASATSNFAWTIGVVTGSITGASATSGATIGQTLTNPSSSASGTVQYLVTPTSTSGSCAGSATIVTITVNPAPAVSGSTALTICSGTSPNIALSASIASSFSWTLGTNNGSISGATASSGASINQTLTNPSNSASGSIEYVVVPTSTSGSCVGAATTITVTVNPTPAITNSASVNACNGVSPNIALTSSVASSYAWTIGTITGSITGSSANSGGAINQTLTNPSNATAGTVPYIVTPTSTVGLCVGSSYTITVTVNPTPVVTTASTATICSGVATNVSLTATAPSNFSWTIGVITGGITGASASSGSAISQTLTNPVTTSAGTVQYLVTPTTTSGSCAGAAYTITVTVNPAPEVTNAATATVCSGTSPSISLTSSVPSSFSWTLGTNTGSISGALAGSGGTINQTLTNPSNTTSGSIVYVVTPVSTTGTCTGSSSSITVTVNPVPAITTAATKSICSGSTTGISLSSSVTSNYTWTVGTITGGITGASASSGSTINQALTNPSGTTSGSVEYLVVATSASGSCAAPTYTITVTVNPVPVVSNAATASICSGTATGIVLTSGLSSSYSWTIGSVSGGITGSSAGSGATINQTLTNPTNTTNGSVVYLVTPTSTGASCVGSATAITVTVYPLPLVTNSATATVCSGVSPAIALTSGVASSFSWTVGTITGGITGASASSGNTLNQLLINPSNASDGTLQYIVTPTSTAGSCVGSATTITLTVIHSPAVTSSSAVSICSGTSTNSALTANEASNFSWTIGAITGSITGASASSGATINQVLTNPSNTTVGTVEYLVTPTSTVTSCAGTVTYITVTVNPAPSITTATTAAVCSGSSPSITLTSSIPASYSWTVGTISGGITGASASSGTTINQTLTNPSNSTVGTVDYVVSPVATSGSCVGINHTITVTVNVSPIAVVAAGGNQTVCSGTAIPVAIAFSTSNSVVGTTYSWTRNDTVNVTGTTSGSGSITGLVLSNTTILPRTVTFTITPTGPAPTFCVGAPITTTVVINPVPTLTSSLTPAAICTGGTFNYTPTSNIGGSTYSWSRALVTNIAPATSSGTSVVSESLTNSTTSPINVTYEYQVTASGCTNPTTFSVVLAVNVYPSLSSDLTPSDICSGATFTYTPTSLTPSTSFTWTRAAVSGISNIAGSGTGNPSEILYDTISTPVNVKYVYTSAAGGCTNSIKDTVVVVVKPEVELSSTLTPAAICSGTVFSYTPTSTTGGATFDWNRAAILNISNPLASGTNNPNETLVNTSANPVSVTYTYSVAANGCSYNQNVVVVVNPIPVFTSTLTPSAICSGTAFSYTPQSSTTGATFAWSRAGVIGISNSPTSGVGNPNETLINTTDSSLVVEYVYLVSANGCSNPTAYSVDVTVSLVPALSSTLSPPAICSGTIFSYTPTSATSATSFVWTRAAVVGITNIAGAGTANPNEPLTNTTSATINVEYVYTLTANGCTNPTTYTVVVPVYPSPTLSSSLNPPAVCSGTTFNYAATSATLGASFSWTRAAVTGISNVAGIGTGDVSEVITNTTTEPITVTYVYTVSANGCSNMFNVNVVVNPIPLFTSTLAPAATCSGALFTYTPASSTLGATYTWNRAAITGVSNVADSGIANVSEMLIDTTVAPVINVTYVYTVSANGCTNPSTYNVIVTVNPTPLFTSSLNPPEVCSGSVFAYTPTSSTTGTSFSWSRSPVLGISNIGASGTDSPNETLINTTVDSVNVTYVYSLTANGCTNPTTYSVVVAVNAAPVLSSNLFPSAICSGTAFSYSPQSLTPGATFVWNRAAVSGIFNASGAGVNNPNEILIDTTALQQNVTYVYTVSAKGCSANTSITVTVNPLPILTTTITPAQICNNSIFSYAPQSSTPSTSFDWIRPVVIGVSNPADTGSNNPNELLINTSSSPINVTYQYTLSANGCANTIVYNVVVTVNPNAPLTSSLSPPIICSGSLFAYVPTSSVVGASFSWTRAAVPGISNLSGSGTGSPDEVLLNTTTDTVYATYIYTVSINGCANPTTYNVVVGVIPSPILTSTASPSAICSHSVFSYVPTSQLSGVTFTWTRPSVTGLNNIASGGNDSINETLILTDTVPVNVTYYFILSTASCANADIFAVVVTVNKPCLCTHQLTSTLNPTSLCNNAAFSYAPTSSTPGALFTWTRAAVTGISNNAGSGSGNPNETLTNTTSSPIDVTYLYTVFADGCANPSPFSVVVTVYPTPVLTSTLTPPAMCSGSAFMYTPTSGTPGAIFNWTRDVVSGISNIAGNGAGGPNEILTNTSTAPVVVTYVYTVSANGCTSATTYSVELTVNPTPVLSSSLTPSAICSGATFNYTPTSATASVVFDWNRLAASGISEAPASGTGNPNEVLTNLTSYSLYVTYQFTLTANNCSYNQDVNVTVNPIPLLSSTVDTLQVCSGSSFSYTPASATAGVSFAWVRDVVTNITNPAGSGNGNPNETLTNTSTDPVNVVYEYTVLANSCSNASAYSVVVTVNPIPAINSSFAPVTICSGTLFSYLPTSATPNASFTWVRDAVVGISNASGAGVGNPNEILIDTLVVPANTNYEFIVSANGCVDTTPYVLTVTVDPYSLNVDAGQDQSITLGSSVTLNATGGLSYSWEPITGFNNPNSPTPTVTPLETTTYTLTVTDGKGCVGTDTVLITVIPDQTLIISSILTPNGDGKNDTWIIQNIENYLNTEIIIVNNQGQKVYMSSSYQNDWAGTFNGKQLPDGTYYYFLKFVNNDKVYSGAVTIFRD
jgi:gliding motility-associated-like protein